jgi:uncharacterized protein (TIGR01777 family)
MRVVIPGGSGQVGTLLARAFSAGGDDVVVLSRRTPDVATVPSSWRTVGWDARTMGDWGREIDGADVVINLAGRSVNCRYTAENRRAILDSRVESTRIVGESIARSTHPPPVWLQASTATLYAHRFDAPNDEHTGIIGGNEPDAPAAWHFSTDVVQAWERALADAPTPATRKVAMRSAMIMAPDRGGIFDTLLRLVRLGLGGAAAGGRQYVSWIHDDDFVGSVRWLIRRADLDGPVNLASPNPLPYAEFMGVLRRRWGMPIGLPATRWMLSLGARLMGSETELVLKSRRVVPARLLESGFQFQYPLWEEAAKNLCDRWKASAASAGSSATA